MSWLWLGLLVVLLLIVVLWWRLRRRKHAMRVLMLHHQRECDQAVQAALVTLDWPNDQLVRSEPVADVWGHGIMAFEYVLPKTTLTQADFAQAMKAQIPTATGAELSPTFVITDWWTRDEQLHMDIAYVVNAATREYVQDVRRV